MSLPLPPTLVQMRRSVAIRAGLATQNDTSLRYQAQIDEYLNKAQKFIDLNAIWARRMVRSTFASVDDETDYDIPTDANIGSIARLAIQDIDGVESELFEDDRPMFEALRLVTKGMPRVYRIIDQVIRVQPKVDAATWPTFIVEYEVRATDLVNDSDRTSVDAEAMIQFATTDIKRMLGLIEANEVGPENQLTMSYLRLLRQQNSPSRSYSMVSSALDGPAYRKYFGGVPTGMGTSLYYAGWSPW